MAVVGVGVDVVAVDRFAAALRRTPALGPRLFTPAELDRRVEGLAARFAAKEAVAKALGAPRGLAWHDVEVLTEDTGRPRLDVRGTVAEAAAGLGVTAWHVTLSHDGGVAVAMVVAEA